MKDIVSVKWLKRNLNNENLILLDSSLNKTADGTASTFKDLTIPTARYFDLKANFSNKKSPYPNTIPSQKQFEVECRKLGINRSSVIIVFDNLGIYSSPRVWWMFKIMGHDNVAVLNGGLKEWIKNKLPTKKQTIETYTYGDFKAFLQKDFIVDYASVKRNIKQASFTIIDARSKGRFQGTENEPRKELKSGHIKGSINIPYNEVLFDSKYKSKKELNTLFEDKCNKADMLVFSCGSGLTACIVLLASTIAFKKSNYLYDGSWTEWAEKNNLKQGL